jgi:hypothetical protein
MSGINPLSGEVEFDLFVGAEAFAGVKSGDVMLKYTTADIAKIQQALQVVGLPEIGAKIEAQDANAVQQCLLHGLKYTETKKPFITNPKWLDDLPFPLGQAAAFIGDALAWQSAGLVGFTARDFYESRIEAVNSGRALHEIFAEKIAARSRGGKPVQVNEPDTLDDSRPFSSSTGSSPTEL